MICICVRQSEKIFLFRLVCSNKRENHKTQSLGKNGETKGHCQGIIRVSTTQGPAGSAQTASRRGGGGKGSLPRHVFHTRNGFMGATKFQGPHYRASREGPHRVEFPALIRHYAIFKSVPWNFFSLTRFYPTSPSLSCLPFFGLNLLFPSRYASFRARSIIENYGICGRMPFSFYCHDNFALPPFLSSYTCDQNAPLRSISIIIIINFECYSLAHIDVERLTCKARI